VAVPAAGPAGNALPLTAALTHETVTMPDLNTVNAFMSTNPVTLNPDMDVLEAVQILTDRSIPGAPVIDDLGNLVGLLAEKDCLEVVFKASYHEEWGGRVSEFMHRNVTTIQSDMSIFDAAALFVETNLRGFPVMDDHRLVGQLNRSDILRALLRLGRERFGNPRR
jgi:predicted transcriptional regulator